MSKKSEFVLKSIIKDAAITVLIIFLCFAFCLIIQSAFEDDSVLIPAIFELGVFLTSVVTSGYFYGVAAALISVLAVNFAFTFPYFAFDFSVPENIISAVILLMVTVITCGLTAEIKRQEAVKTEIEKEKMRANLLRAVSHDLRTPLTTIYGASSALLDNYENFSDKQKKQMLQSIGEDAEWLCRMVENLLSVTRIDGANVSINKINTAVDELVDSVLQKFARRYPEQKVDVTIPDDFVFIPMDPMLIQQVIINLLENAMQHAKGMTKLSLNVFTASNKVFFEIKDNGAGIPADRIKNLFVGVFSNSDDLSDGKNHAGIGLSVCASVIKAHGGEIKAENLKEGGCTFRFVLSCEES